MLASQRHEIFLGKSQGLAQRSEVLFDQIGIEAVMPGRNGRVRGEDDFPCDPRHGLIEADAFFDHALRMASSTANPLCPSFR
jgi:hypothetical protein